MRRFTSICFATAFGLMLHGCAHWDSRAMSYVTNDSADANREQRVFIWGSDYSAGIGTQEGICAQAATTMKSTSVEASAKVSDGLVAVIAGEAASGSPKDAAAAMIALNRNSALTNATSVQTSYANISLFYLCQISLNRKLEADAIQSMWAVAHETATQLSKDAVDVARLLVTPISKLEDEINNEAYNGVS
ncbi:MAG: hypothetical protein V4618_17595 [Pseudomonadota bacterium]